MPLRVRIKRLDPDVPLPCYAHPDDAALDLYARTAVTLAPGERAQVPTGIAMHIPDGYVGFVWDKSGLSHTHGMKTLGGVIDAGYRGEVMVGVVNLGSEPYTFARHHKVAQLFIQERAAVAVEEVRDLEDSIRGEQGFGSTGR